MPIRAKNAWPSLEPGELRHQIQIQASTQTPDAVGQLRSSWNTVWTTWAKIESLSLRELDQANQVTSQVTHRITIRYPAGISIMAGMQIVYATHTYKVQAVDNFQERNTVLRLLCLEINSVE